MANDHLLGLTLVKKKKTGADVCSRFVQEWTHQQLSMIEANLASFLDAEPFYRHRYWELGSHYLQFCNHWWPCKAPHIALYQFWYHKINHLKKFYPLFFHPTPAWFLLFPLKYGMAWPLFVVVVRDRVAVFSPDCARTPSGQGRMEG